MAVFLCTAGEEIGIMSRRAMQLNDYLKGYIYDIIGSEIVEVAADLMQNELENQRSQRERKSQTVIVPDIADGMWQSSLNYFSLSLIIIVESG